MAAMGAAFVALVFVGADLRSAAAIAAAGTAGGITVGCRLTVPHVAPRVGVVVLLVVLALIVCVVQQYGPAPECVAVVLATAWCTAGLARRLPGLQVTPVGRLS